jgi:hypothetical protein
MASVVERANGGKHASFSQGEHDHLLDNPQNQLGAAGDVKFLEKAVQMHMHSVRRNLECFGNLRLRVVVEDAFDDLQLTLRDVEGGSDLKPSVVGEQ